jgi:putative transposase
MGRKAGTRTPSEREPLPTIWEMPDDAWERIEAILLDAYPPAPTGRPRIDFRAAIDGIVFRLRSGCQWNRLPERFGDDSSVHRWFQRWAEDGIFEAIRAELLLECEELGGVDWRWQAADGVMGKSRFDGEKRGRARRTAQRWAPGKASSSRKTAVPSAS